MNRLRRTGHRLFAVGIGGLLLGCNSSPPPPIVTTLTTAVVVVPEDFLGNLPCTADPGAMQTYRATLVDVTDGLDENSPELQSPLISCKKGAYFEGVTVGNRYIARVAGYDRADLGLDSSEAAVDADGNPVMPDWSTTCYGNEIPDQAGLGGDSAGGAANDRLGVEAYSQARVYVRACAPLTRASEAGQTGAVIGIENSLGALECGEEPDMVDHFTVQLEDGVGDESEDVSLGGSGGAGGAGGTSGGGGAGTDRSASCGETVTVLGLVDGVNYTFEVVAFEADSTEPRWGTSCRMTARGGVLVRANCESLQPLN